MAAPCVLVVEDDSTIRETLAELLADEGYGVTCAANGVEALALLGTEERPALILLDLMMPVMNGWDLRRALADDPRLAAIPVVVLSAAVASGGRPSDIGADEFLAKPFDLSTLLDTVQRLC